MCGGRELFFVGVHEIRIEGIGGREGVRREIEKGRGWRADSPPQHGVVGPCVEESEDEARL